LSFFEINMLHFIFEIDLHLFFEHHMSANAFGETF